MGFASTGQRVAFGTVEIWRVARGKFAEHWDLVDVSGLQKELRGD
jgi:predicted ester cyclase